MEQGHDHKEFVRLYEDHKNELFTYFMYRLNFDRALSEDLLMDVVLKTYANFHTFDPKKGSFKNWVFTIAHNHLVNYWRRQGRTGETVSLDALEENGITAAITYIQETVSEEIDHQAIQRILFLLKEPEREIITLRYLNQLTLEEISEMMHKKPGAIRTTLSRALKQFQSLYEKLYPQTS